MSLENEIAVMNVKCSFITSIMVKQVKQRCATGSGSEVIHVRDHKEHSFSADHTQHNNPTLVTSLPTIAQSTVLTMNLKQKNIKDGGSGTYDDQSNLSKPRNGAERRRWQESEERA